MHGPGGGKHGAGHPHGGGIKNNCGRPTGVWNTISGFWTYRPGLKNIFGSGAGGKTTGGVGNGAGNAKNILFGSGAGAYVTVCSLITFPPLTTMGPGAAGGSMIGAGGGACVSLTSRLAPGPPGTTIGAAFPLTDGVWIITGPGAGPGAMT